MESGHQADVQEHGSRVQAQSLILVLDYGFPPLVVVTKYCHFNTCTQFCDLDGALHLVGILGMVGLIFEIIWHFK